MAKRSQKTVPSESDVDRYSDEVDPRVQIELERLNTATDDINKLEVDLDEARAAFRQLLCESTVRIDSLAKKLGTCVEKARPYYEARMKAKEALLETQQAAVRFERANSAHSAAKEMVFLAEEGLCAEGRTFDQAWQEMLNHATIRVNESERERTLSEVEHRRTSQMYHRAEMRVQQLQKDLKRAIAKSSMNARRSLLQINSLAYQHRLQLLPYFEMKAQFNHSLEEQKRKVKLLENQVCQSKMSYSEALRNLEQISDEIHRTRKYKASGGPLDVRRPGVGADSPQPQTNSADLISESNDTEGPPPRSSSSQTDTGEDMWSDSTGTGPPDSDSEEYLRLPDKLGPNASPVVEKAKSESVTSQMSEYLSLSGLSNGRGGPEEVERGAPLSELIVRSQDSLQCSGVSPRHTTGSTVMETSFMDAQSSSIGEVTPQGEEWDRSLDSPLLPRDSSSDQVWTEIKLVESPDETSQTFAKMGSYAHKKVDRDYIQYSPVGDDSSRSQYSDKTDGMSFSSVIKKPFLPIASFPEKSFLPQSPLLKSRTSDQPPKGPESSEDNKEKEAKPGKLGGMSLFRTGSVDRPSHGSLSGWISRSSIDEEARANQRRQSLDTLLFGGQTTEKMKELLSHGMMMLNISSLTDKKQCEGPKEVVIEDVDNTGIDDGKNNILLGKKAPSPLEKSLVYLNAEEDSTSDSESLASVEMLSDEQISSLMLEQDIQDACEEVLGTPMSEISPLIQDLRHREMRLLHEKEQEP